MAVTVLPEVECRAPDTWARRVYRNLFCFHVVEKGGDVAAWDVPELFASELWEAFRLLR